MWAKSTLSLVIPTAGRPSLAATLASIKPQLRSGDEVIVVGDTRAGDLPQTEAIVAQYGRRFRYVPFTDGAMTWGHSQCNHGLGLASGDYVLCQDDDDIYTADALDSVRATIRQYPRRPLLFQFQSYHGEQVFWHTPGLVREGALGGHCLVSPNVPGKVGRYSARYQGDFDWVADTLTLWQPVQPVWVEQIITIARPVAQRRTA